MYHSQRLRRLVGTVMALAMIGLAVPVLLLVSPGEAAEVKPAYSETKELKRIWQKQTAEGEVVDVDEPLDQRKVTVQVDKTRQLRGRERVHITWSNAHPTSGRALFPFGAQGLDQENPVVILQCRGREGDAKNPLRPETCWTSTQQQRSEVNIDSKPLMRWRMDAYASAEDRTATFGGVDASVAKAKCLKSDSQDSFLVLDNPDYASHLTPFLAQNGTVYPACDGLRMPPEASPEAAFPAAEQAAFTDKNGRGDAFFEVRSNIENESLGCSDKVACSIVVIPVLGISCAPKETAVDFIPERHSSALFTSCRDTQNKQEVGGTYDGGDLNRWVSGQYWWTPSNWNNRFTIPITFAPPPNVCELLDDRAPVGFYGSELMSQAGLQWAPAYCLNKTRFKFQANKMPDDAAFDLLGSGGADAAFVARERTSSDPVGYAPTAITGFAVGYVADRPNNLGELTRLKLTPRLLAKLLTTSYSAFPDKRDRRPGLINNPMGINLDPEFQALNPDATAKDIQAAAAVMSISVSSDVMWRLTDYLNRDPEARAFLNGNPDPWGMLVNPAYKGIALPVADWPLNDTWRVTRGEKCVTENTTPLSTQLAAPVTSLRTIAEALIDAAPLMQTKAAEVLVETNGVTSWICKYSRPDRLGLGQRMMLGIVDLGDADRFGLRTAALQTSATNSGQKFNSDAGRTFAAPDQAGLRNALAAYTPAGKSVPFAFDPKKIADKAYPGTMVVYTAAKLTGLDLTKAKNVASFIRIATTEGQAAGRNNGQLPGGYLPLTKTGSTAALWRQAQTVADLIEEQKAVATPTPTPSETPDGTDTATPDPAASAAAAAAAADKSTSAAGPVTTVLETDPSAVKTSKIAALLLPLLILGAALCMLATPILRMVIAQGDDR
jgi:hypothetical protein